MITKELLDRVKAERSHVICTLLTKFNRTYWIDQYKDKATEMMGDARGVVARMMNPLAEEIEQAMPFQLEPLDLFSIWTQAMQEVESNVLRYRLASAIAFGYLSHGYPSLAHLYTRIHQSSSVVKAIGKIAKQNRQAGKHLHEYLTMLRTRGLALYDTRADLGPENRAIIAQLNENWANGVGGLESAVNMALR